MYSSSEEEEELVFGGLDGIGGSLNLPAGLLEGTLLQIFKLADATGWMSEVENILDADLEARLRG